MAQRFRGMDDFEATIRILRADEGGRSSRPRNGIRWDLCYASDDPQDGIWMIWPDFLDANGESRSEAEELPVDSPLPAKMLVVSDEIREEAHRHEITVGTRFYCHEGGRRVAEGVVTRITGLVRKRQTKEEAEPGATDNPDGAQ